MKRRRTNKAPAKARHVDLRVDQETYDKIAIASAEMGITVSEYIRQMLAKGKIVRKEYTVVNPEALNEILYHLGHVSGNLNQIARFHNGGGLRSREMYENIGRALSDLYDISVKSYGWEAKSLTILEHLAIKKSDYGDIANCQDSCQISWRFFLTQSSVLPRSSWQSLMFLLVLSRSFKYSGN